MALVSLVEGVDSDSRAVVARRAVEALSLPKRRVILGANTLLRIGRPFVAIVSSRAEPIHLVSP